MQELNTAEDFISCYEEIIPVVQTLPLVILHKESIFSNLISRVQMKARLSLEPILRYAKLIWQSSLCWILCLSFHFSVYSYFLFYSFCVCSIPMQMMTYMFSVIVQSPYHIIC